VSLHGTLETFALPDVMTLLAATKKTGELRVVGGKLDGRVHLDAGRVIAASVGRADSFVDAVFELLRLTSGKFSFDAEKQPEDPSDPVDIEPLLLEAQSRLSAWREIEAVVPSMAHGVGLVKDLSDPHVTLASEQWRMVVAVAASACVNDVADRLSLGEYAACKALKDLVESGVVELSDPPAPSAKPKAAAGAAKAEPKPEPVVEAEPEPVVAAEPVVEAEPESTVEKAKAADKAEKAQAKAAIEPELKPKPLPEQPVAVPALTKVDSTRPFPPGEEPEAKPAAPAPPKKVAASTSTTGNGNGAAKAGVNASEAKQLVSQLAAMSSEKPAAGGKDKDKADKPEAKAEAASEEAVEAAEGAPAEGGDAEEPLNRGLLLKFLSSVRQ
jgi:Domain of unknown function (DUF4388)